MDVAAQLTEVGEKPFVQLREVERSLHWSDLEPWETHWVLWLEAGMVEELDEFWRAAGSAKVAVDRAFRLWSGTQADEVEGASAEDDQQESSPSTSSSEHSSESPRMGDREGMCKCSSGHGSHGCRAYLEPGETELCAECTPHCTCDCDQCEDGRERAGLATGNRPYWWVKPPKPWGAGDQGQGGGQPDGQTDSCYALEEQRRQAAISREIARRAPQAARDARGYIEQNPTPITDTKQGRGVHTHEAPEGSDGLPIGQHANTVMPTERQVVMRARGIRVEIKERLGSRMWEVTGWDRDPFERAAEGRRIGGRASNGGAGDGSHRLVTGWDRDPFERTTEGRRFGGRASNGGAGGEPAAGQHDSAGRRPAVHALGTEDEHCKPALMFAAFIGDRTMGCGIDTYAETSPVRESVVDTAWEVVISEGLDVSGVGEGTMGRLVMVPMRLRYCGEEIRVAMRVTADAMMPRDVDLLFGTTVQETLGIEVDARNERAKVWELGLCINLEEAWVITERMRSRGLRALDLCAGSSSSYATLRDLGWNIEMWHAVESSDTARAVAEENFRGKVLHVATDVADFSADGEEAPQYDVILAGPPCQPWSRANRKAMGFADDRATAFIHCCRIIHEAKLRNPRAQFMLENVEVQSTLKADEQLQEEMLQCEFGVINAKELGAGQSRPRRVASNIAHVDQLRRKQPVDPNLFLERLGSSMDRRVAPCVMAAGSNTHTPVRVRDAVGERCASLDELEALQGYSPGTSAAQGRIELTYEERATIIGNAFHYELVCALMSEMDPEQFGGRGVGMHNMSKEPRVDSTIPYYEAEAPEPSALEKRLTGMTDVELEGWMETRLEGYKAPELTLTLKAEETAPYQVPKRSRYQTGDKLSAAVRAALRVKLADRSMKLMPYSREQWISMMFVKAKGRIDPKTQEEAVRFLTDLRALNSALEWPAHWNEHMPTVQELRESIPAWARWFASEDTSNAFESMWLAENVRHMVTVAPPVKLSMDDFTEEELREWGYTDAEIEAMRGESDLLLGWQGCPQGLAPAAPFWNVHIQHGFNTLFGEEWRDFWAQYVDDQMVYGATKEQCEARQRMLRFALKALGKEGSAKTDRSVSEVGHIAGLKFVQGGVTLDDAAVDALVVALQQPIKREKDARALVGIMIYAATAFEWDTEDMLWFSRHLAPMSESYKGHTFEWTEECKESVAAFRARVKVAPRVPCRPEELVQLGWRLVIKSDGSNEGVGSCLLLVKCGADGVVTPDMLRDPTKVRLISTDSKILSEAEQKWLTFEIETYGMYRALRKWAALLMRVAQIGVHRKEVHPPLLWMDSTVGVAKWIGMAVPGHIDHASAKEKRFLAWAEKVAYVKWLTIDMRWIPGSDNDFADLLSRMAIKLRTCIDERRGAPQMRPMQRMTYHTNSGAGEDVMQQYEMVHLGMTQEDWEEVRRAYLADNTVHQSVRMSDLYRCATMDGEGVDPEIVIKVKPWVGRRYFGACPPGSTIKVMYTQRAQLREHWKRDDTRVLVLVVPAGAMVRKTNAPEVVLEEDAEEYEMVDLRRDLLLLHHDNNGHPKPGPTMTAIKAVAYWPSMCMKEGKDSVQRHWEMCAHCMAVETSFKDHGCGIDSMERMRVIQIDHVILTDEEAALCEAIGSLTVIDVATRMRIYKAVQTQTAVETAEVIIADWAPHHGYPDLIISDPHSGFGSDVLKEIRQMLGIKDHEFAAARAKGKVAVVESSHRMLRQQLDDGFSKGDITSLRKYKMYLSFAAQKGNLVGSAGRIPPVQLWSGQKVRTAQKLALVAEGTINLEGTDTRQGEFIQALRMHVEDMQEYEFHMRDGVARKNALRSDKNDQMTNSMRFQFKEGEEVSFEGKKCKVVELHGEPGHPVTAAVKTHMGNTKRVRYDEMRVLSAAMPVRMMPVEVELGSFVLWIEDGLCGGSVEAVHGGKLEVMAREQDVGTGKNWLPTWKKEDEVLRRKVAPDGFVKNMVEVDASEVKMVGELTDTHRVTDATWRAMVARDLV